MMLFIIIITFMIAIIPVDLFAWGLETHIKVGMSILENISFSVIKQYPTYFLLGNIFPDFFTLLKNLSKFKKNLDTHSWSIVAKLFKNATKDENISFTHGYAAHLAADVIAHNYLVPQNFLLISKSRYISHLFLEYAESCDNEDTYTNVLDSILEFADNGCEFFLNIEGINKEYFLKQLHYLKMTIKYQRTLRLRYLARFFEKLVDASFKDRSKYYRKKAYLAAANAVESGFSRYVDLDPKGKKAMMQARDIRQHLFSNDHNKHTIRNTFIDPITKIAHNI